MSQTRATCLVEKHGSKGFAINGPDRARSNVHKFCLAGRWVNPLIDTGLHESSVLFENLNNQFLARVCLKSQNSKKAIISKMVKRAKCNEKTTWC